MKEQDQNRVSFHSTYLMSTKPVRQGLLHELHLSTCSASLLSVTVDFFSYYLEDSTEKSSPSMTTSTQRCPVLLKYDYIISEIIEVSAVLKAENIR